MPIRPAALTDFFPMHARLCILSSSSRGNCSALVIGEGDTRRLFLIDAGLSPRRTRRLLAEVGLGGVPILGVLLTHLDVDHWNANWSTQLDDGATILLHRKHLGRARREGVLVRRTEPFDEAFELCARVHVNPLLLTHDDLGAACFRISFEETGRSLGFATDLGQPTDDLIQHLAGVDVLAIESNYCPRLQEESGRPWFLKQRITGGKGHLSNQQSAGAVASIAPREHVVLLHLSPQCNRAALAAAEHSGRSYTLTISNMDRPTPWITVSSPGHQPRPIPEVPRLRQPTLWPAIVP
jgi:phosphoribosyl 1,2-cyclic phosphodiesterase